MRARNEVKQVLWVMSTFVVIIFVLYNYEKWNNGDHTKTSVLKLQVGLLGTGRLLQRELNRIAKVADTSNSKGLHFVLEESILALLGHSEYCISGYSSVDDKLSVAGCEKRFNQMSIEERGKFDEETLVNVNNIKKKSATSQSSNGLPNEYSVGAEVLWTPQKEDDSLTEQEMLEDYPLLRPL